MIGSDPKQSREVKQPNAINATAQAPQAHLLSREEIQKQYGLTRRWLEQAASSGNGPTYVKIGNRTVRYRRTEIERWLTEREVRSTSDMALQVQRGAK